MIRVTRATSVWPGAERSVNESLEPRGSHVGHIWKIVNPDWGNWRHCDWTHDKDRDLG